MYARAGRKLQFQQIVLEVKEAQTKEWQGKFVLDGGYIFVWCGGGEDRQCGDYWSRSSGSHAGVAAGAAELESGCVRVQAMAGWVLGTGAA